MMSLWLLFVLVICSCQNSWRILSEPLSTRPVYHKYAFHKELTSRAHCFPHFFYSNSVKSWIDPLCLAHHKATWYTSCSNSKAEQTSLAWTERVVVRTFARKSENGNHKQQRRGFHLHRQSRTIHTCKCDSRRSSRRCNHHLRECFFWPAAVNQRSYSFVGTNDRALRL